MRIPRWYAPCPRRYWTCAFRTSTISGSYWGADEEMGYDLQQSKGFSHNVPLKTRLYNRSYVPGRESSITVDFGGRLLKNEVKVDTTGKTFLRKIRIEGSDDQQTWKIVRDGAFLFRAEGDDGRVQEKSTVTFPDNNQEYLRITVFPGDDDPDVIEIKNVEAWQLKRKSADTEVVPIVSSGTSQRKNVTEITLDLRFRNMPLSRLQLAFSDKNFFRAIDVAGRNRAARVVRTVVEDSPKFEKSVTEPWMPITSGTIYRFTTGKRVEESLGLGLQGAKYRYLRVRIKNRDDPPLVFTGAHVDRFVQNLRFAGKNAAQYMLYCGNPKARRPEYDVGRYIGRLRREDVTYATLGAVIPNPAHQRVSRKVPWSEQHSVIIWVALLAMVAVLCFLIYRIATSKKSLSNQPPEESG